MTAIASTRPDKPQNCDRRSWLVSSNH